MLKNAQHDLIIVIIVNGSTTSTDLLRKNLLLWQFLIQMFCLVEGILLLDLHCLHLLFDCFHGVVGHIRIFAYFEWPFLSAFSNKFGSIECWLVGFTRWIDYGRLLFIYFFIISKLENRISSANDFKTRADCWGYDRQIQTLHKMSQSSPPLYLGRYKCILCFVSRTIQKQITLLCYPTSLLQKWEKYLKRCNFKDPPLVHDWFFYQQKHSTKVEWWCSWRTFGGMFLHGVWSS